jgi:hypothetical protein
MLRHTIISALGLSLYTSSSTASSIPQHPMISPAGLWEILPDAKGINVWFSNIMDTIWGEDATDFDYYLNGRSGDIRHFDSAIESVEHFAKVFPEGDPDTVLIAFHNYSMSGTLSTERAADKQWLCYELDCPMNRIAEACRDLGAPCVMEEREEL